MSYANRKELKKNGVLNILRLYIDVFGLALSSNSRTFTTLFPSYIIIKHLQHFLSCTEQVDPQEKEPCDDLFPSFVPSFCFMWFVKIRYLSLLQYRIRAVLPHSKEVMGSGISGDCNWTDGWTDCVVPFKKWYRTCAHICQCQATTAMHTNNNNQGRVGAIFFFATDQHKADSY